MPSRIPSVPLFGRWNSDVRFLPNPFYFEDLKNKNGNDKEVQDYVLGFLCVQGFSDLKGCFLNAHRCLLVLWYPFL